MNPALQFERPLAFAVLALLSACGGGETRPATLAELRQGLEGAESIEIQYTADSVTGGLFEAIEAAGRSLEQRLDRRVLLREGISADSTESPRIVIGCPTDPGVEDLFLALGGSIDGQSVLFAGVEVGRDASLLHICAEDPERPGLPLQLLTSRIRGALLESVEDLMPRAVPGATLREGQDPLLHLEANVSGTPEQRRREGLTRFTSTVRGGGVLLRHQSDVTSERAEKYKARSVRSIARVSEWMGETPEARLELLGVGRGDRLRELLGKSDLAVGDGHPGRRVVLLAPGVPDDRGALAARWAANQVLGTPHSNWLLDGVAIDAAGHWWGRPLDEWGRYLAAAQLLPSIEELVSDRSVDRYSQHVLAPARGLLLRTLRELHGDEVLGVLWRDSSSVAGDIVLQEAFVSRLANLNHEVPPNPTRGVPDGVFLRGLAIDSDARSGGGGYDARGLYGAVRAAAGLDANATSITSYFSEDPVPSGPYGGRLPLGRTCLEGDAAVAEAISVVRRAGIATVMLQPHLLLSDSAGYSAWLRRTNRAHWEEFFEELDPMIVHYGLLAELCGVDIMCIGTSLSTASANSGLVDEVRSFYDERWRQAIGLARRSFGGLLTYAATWPGEATNVRFWSELDLIGLSIFPRLAALDEEPQGKPALRARWSNYLAGIESLSEEAGKPALVVELGVRSTELAATEVSVGTGDLNLEEQERVLSAFVDALSGREESGGELWGVFFWKWTHDLRGGGAHDRGFTLQNKPAARLLSRLPRAVRSSSGDENSEEDGD